MDSSSFLILLTVLNLPVDFAGAAGVRAILGEDNELPCSIYTYKNVTELRWTRLDKDIRLLHFEEGKFTVNANYTDRIYLLDPQLQRGNYSLILKNVTEEDDGSYECKAIYIDEHSAASDTYSFSFSVVDPADLRDSGPPVKFFLPALVFSLLMGMILL